VINLLCFQICNKRNKACLNLNKVHHCNSRYESIFKFKKKNIIATSVADPDPVLFYPLDPGSGSGMYFFRIPGLGSRGYRMFFLCDFLKNPCSFIFLLIKHVSETIRSKKKVGFIFHPSLCTVGSGIRYFFTHRILDPG
jgi:hypothetical protein